MIMIPNSTLNEFKECFDKYRLCVNTMNIYFNTIRMINKHHCYLDNDTFMKYYWNFTKDIEIESIPYECFIPDHGQFEQNEHIKRIFIINRDAKEYVRIQKRVTLEDLFKTIPSTEDIVSLLKDKPDKFVDVVDDIFIYWSVHKYLDSIDMLRIQSISVMTPAIEYVVNNITYDMWKDYLSTKKINPEKCDKYLTDNLFGPDYDYTNKYYLEDHIGFAPFNVEELICKLCTNIIVKTDIYMIIAVYLILTFAKVDINDEKYDESPCATYVKDVLSKL